MLNLQIMINYLSSKNLVLRVKLALGSRLSMYWNSQLQFVSISLIWLKKLLYFSGIMISLRSSANLLLILSMTGIILASELIWLKGNHMFNLKVITQTWLGFFLPLPLPLLSPFFLILKCFVWRRFIDVLRLGWNWLFTFVGVLSSWVFCFIGTVKTGEFLRRKTPRSREKWVTDRMKRCWNPYRIPITSNTRSRVFLITCKRCWQVLMITWFFSLFARCPSSKSNHSVGLAG